MTQAEEILKLIETVDPNDTEKLDEIDAITYCWMKNEKYINHNTSMSIINGNYAKGWRLYTRSRDALKAIRPEGWTFHVDATAPDLGVNFTLCKNDKDCIGDLHRGHPYGEELSELYAIIQAIEYERNNEQKV